MIVEEGIETGGIVAGTETETGRVVWTENRGNAAVTGTRVA